MEEFLEPIKIKIYYDEEVKKITGKNFEEIISSEGIDFVNQLYFIFSSYPKIQEKFPAGQLGLLLNNKKPKEYDILKDGDEIRLIGMKNSISEK